MTVGYVFALGAWLYMYSLIKLLILLSMKQSVLIFSGDKGSVTLISWLGCLFFLRLLLLRIFYASFLFSDDSRCFSVPSLLHNFPSFSPYFYLLLIVFRKRPARLTEYPWLLLTSFILGFLRHFWMGALLPLMVDSVTHCQPIWECKGGGSEFWVELLRDLVMIRPCKDCSIPSQ